MMKFKTEKLSIHRYYRKLFNKLDKIEKQKAKKIGKEFYSDLVEKKVLI